MIILSQCYMVILLWLYGYMVNFVILLYGHSHFECTVLWSLSLPMYCYMVTLTSNVLLYGHSHFQWTVIWPLSLPMYCYMVTLTSNVLLYGHSHFEEFKNKFILEATITYVKNSERFSGSAIKPPTSYLCIYLLT